MRENINFDKNKITKIDDILFVGAIPKGEPCVCNVCGRAFTSGGEWCEETGDLCMLTEYCPIGFHGKIKDCKNVICEVCAYYHPSTY